MKALVRGNEVMTEPFSKWVEANLRWLCGEEVTEDGEKLPGDGWTLVEDYEPPTEETEETEEISEDTVTETVTETPEETSEMTIEEAKKILGIE